MLSIIAKSPLPSTKNWTGTAVLTADVRTCRQSCRSSAPVVILALIPGCSRRNGPCWRRSASGIDFEILRAVVASELERRCRAVEEFYWARS